MCDTAKATSFCGGIYEGAADDEADEEARQHGTGLEAAAESLHAEDGEDGVEKEAAAADEGHEGRVAAGETLLWHQRGHVVRDSVGAVDWSRKTMMLA